MSKPARQQPRETTPDFLDGVTVLLVDDADDVRRVLARMLRGAGAAVVDADGGATAVALMREHGGIDVAVLDLAMPGSDGLATLRELRHLDPGLPAVTMSGFYEEPQMVADAMGRGTAFLEKPFSRGDLLSALEQVLGEA
ncbi:MAG: response regulator [Dehalococcoidia bacterium]|nr:response regulator [Dehalococcoidia bacterium]